MQTSKRCLTSRPTRKRMANMPAALARSGMWTRDNQTYLEFQLDRSTLRVIESLARQSRRTPFETCVQLVVEGMSEANASSVHADAPSPVNGEPAHESSTGGWRGGALWYSLE